MHHKIIKKQKKEDSKNKEKNNEKLNDMEERLLKIRPILELPYLEFE